ncbi:Set domain protein [Hibiscus syriacus]|uniref:Set domain protein n=1 Tax=Hibiscus syriacus TaxID=106335 RepID=A0A6A2WZ09_HIBSY|nr:Set domain protein [Hibiscus syriacus]
MAPNPRIKQAFRSMEEIGISKEKVKPVLKKLLKLYDKNWELIESENYRVLADAIFDEDDSKVPEHELDKNNDEEDIEEEGSVPDEVVCPLKRRRLRKKYDQESCSHRNDSSNGGGTLFKKPKVEEDELPPAPLQQQPLQCNVENIRAESLPASVGPVSYRPTFPAPVSPHQGGRNTGKQTVEPSPLVVQKRPDPNSHLSQTHVRYKGKEPISPHVASGRNGLERASRALCIKGPAPEPGISPKVSLPVTHALIIPKEEPFTDDIPVDEIPIAVIHPDSSNERGLSAGYFSTAKPNWQEPPESLHADKIVGAGASASMSERHSSCDLTTVPKEIPSSLEIASTPLGELCRVSP